MTVTKVFVDTAPIIYLVEENPNYHPQVSLLLAETIRRGSVLTTSVLSVAEVGIKPKRIGKIEILDKFSKIIGSLFEVCPITWDVAEISSTLRSKYSSLKAIDSLQIAAAINAKCEIFVTNDKRLKTIKEIPVLLISSL